MSIVKKAAFVLFSLGLKFKRLKYRMLSNARVEGKPVILHPTLMSGDGKISFGDNVRLGYEHAGGYYSGYSIINVRNGGSVTIGNDVHINNNFSIYADKACIAIGDGVIIGNDVSIANSDFHRVDPATRKSDIYPRADIKIGMNVWIGAKVTILKGVDIGDNSVVAACSFVNKDIPGNQLWGGIPARFIRDI